MDRLWAPWRMEYLMSENPDGCLFCEKAAQDAKHEAFLAFIRSDAFREVTNWGKEQILAGRPRHRIFAAEEV